MRTKVPLYVIGLAVVLLSAAPAVIAAQIKTNPNFAMIYLSGDIDADTPGQLEETLRAVRPQLENEISLAESEGTSLKGQLTGLQGAHLFLDSGGGDVLAAIKAGEVLRSHHVSIVVPENRRCASACVLLLVGGIERLILGSVGIHRPFSTEYSQSLTESDERYRTISAAVEKYLRVMNMPTRLIEAMNAVPPDQIRWLTDSDVSDFAIGGADPVWKDRYDSVQARAIGITKQEYYARMQRGHEQCDGLQEEAWARCYFDIVGRPK